MCEIRNFNEFLEKSLSEKVLDYTLKPLTKPGENYGSVMQLVEVKIIKNTEVRKNFLKNR